MKEMMPIPAGALFYVSTGAYSDYSVWGVYRAKAAINANALRDEWLEVHPGQKKSYAFRSDAFFSWAAAKDLFEPVEAYEWHLADYSNPAEMYVDKNKE